MDNFSPLTLRRQQFGVIAATVIMLSAIPILSAVRQPTHLVPLDISPLEASVVVRDPVLVKISAYNEIRVDDRLVTLDQLSSLAMHAQTQNKAIFVNPDKCALHDTFVKALAVLQKTGHKGIRLTFPQFPLGFGRSSREPQHIIEGVYMSSGLNLPKQEFRRFRTTRATTIVIPEECRIDVSAVDALVYASAA